MAKHNVADPTSKHFWKDLESMLLQVAVMKKSDYEFIQTKKCYLDSNGIPSVHSVQRYKMMFEEKCMLLVSLLQSLVFKARLHLRCGDSNFRPP